MKNIFIFFLIFLLSCGYPDIDSVPDFENVIISEQESIDLCRLTYSDNKEFINCLVEFYKTQDL